MRDGFVKCAAMIPSIKVADCANNEAEIIRLIDEAATSGAKVVVFPELCITGYTCGDLFCRTAFLTVQLQVLYGLQSTPKDLT